jgi:hypothetical protein
MVRSLLIRGMLIGVLAGLLAFAFAYAFGEPQVQRAVDFERLVAARTGSVPEHELVSRGVQRTLGLLTGTLALGIALGGLFGLVYAFAYGRVAVAGARTTAAVLAAAAFTTLTLVPFMKYPANPPSVGDPATLDRRTLLFAIMIAVTVLAFVAAARLRRQLLARIGAWDAAIVAAGLFLAVVGLAQLIMPSVHEVPTGFPADVLYRFRLASLGTNATLWLVLGLGFGASAQRLLAPAESQRAAAAS